MALNTKIRGAQIELANYPIGVAVDSIAYYTTGAEKIVKTSVANFVGAITGVGLGASSGVLALDLHNLGDVAIDVGADFMAIVDSDDDSTKKEAIRDLITAIAGTGLTATDGVLSVNTITDNLIESDIKVENLSSEIDESGYAGEHTLANTPVVNSVQVFLNGLLQEEGSGKDYMLTGSVIQFAIPPFSGEIIIVHYILND